MSPASARLFWPCGGEILTGGGPFPLATPAGPYSFGCRPISIQRATELWVFYRLQARAVTDTAARRHCRDCAQDLQTAIAQVSAWRRAA